ncbi:MAG: hypothetical protein Q9M22_04025 [Mariprofundaceae bacterium]|nr:hypothetical protein [Mariprofundaceae bacterium]
MNVRPDQLIHAKTPVLYLFGEDQDAVMEHGQALLAQGDHATTRMRLNADEIPRFIGVIRSPSLFGPVAYSGLVGNASSATVAHISFLFDAIGDIQLPHRLIICACGAMYKKAWHKKIITRKDITHCQFNKPSAQGFGEWLLQTMAQSNLNVSQDDVLLMSAQLNGMRIESRQWMARLGYYDGGKGEPVSLSVMRALCGEHSPESLDDWCHATAMRQPQAIHMAHQLLFHQGVGALQMLVWLANRFQQLLMYCWHQACHHANPLQQARAFGVARKLLPQEAMLWNGATLMQALHDIGVVEQQLKGASLLPDRIIMEALTLQLCRTRTEQS